MSAAATSLYLLAKVVGRGQPPKRLEAAEDMARLLLSPRVVFSRAALVRAIPTMHAALTGSDPTETWMLAVYQLEAHPGRISAQLVYYRESGKKNGTWVPLRG